MTRLAPHVAAAVRDAHARAVSELDEAREALRTERARLARAEDEHEQAAAREAELRAALDVHRRAEEAGR